MSNKEYKLPEGKVLVLRTCKPDMSTSYNFTWPESGFVEAPDFKNSTKCGNGLHGWLWGTGDYGLKYKEVGAKWLVVEVDQDQIIELDGKVKFESGNVIYCGNYRGGYDLVKKWFWLTQVKFSKKSMASEKEECAWEPNDHLSASATGYYGHASATGDYGHASATGYSGHASATGYSGHASATGNYGHASATGDYGHASATGYYGHASATGYYGHASATGYSGHASATGYSGHASATGDYGHASATGYYGHASATGYSGHASATGYSGHASATGNYGHASATGYSGHASATGDYGHASATGNSGHASATGDSGIACVLGKVGKAKCSTNGSLILTYWDGSRYRHVVGYEGENGIKKDTWYKLNDKFEFEELISYTPN